MRQTRTSSSRSATTEAAARAWTAAQGCAGSPTELRLLVVNLSSRVLPAAEPSCERRFRSADDSHDLLEGPDFQRPRLPVSAGFSRTDGLLAVVAFPKF